MNVRRLSGCDGKHRFTSFNRARRIAHRQAQNTGGKYEAYACPDCGGFHVGTHLGRGSESIAWIDPRLPYIVYARDAEGHEVVVGRSNKPDGGRTAEVINAEPGWEVTRVVKRRGSTT